ncbi:MAG: sodium:solute symporter [Bacteroidales bacterium]|nr:sodium:solute symporter [Bacteroidales bacterium]
METIILICFLAYTLLLFGVMWLSSRRGSDNDAFFRGQRKSPWPVVAYGMIGASLSGVTFMSVPGGVYAGQFTYLPLCFGYVLGYIVIALVLLPLYYKLNLTSIYSYLEQRFGVASEKTGAFFFIISRLLGSALRMYLVVFVLYEFVFRSWGIPFWVPAVIFIAIILLYTFRGGLKTVVWTDTLQTTFLLLAAIVTVVAILNELDISLPELLRRSSEGGHTRVFETDPTAGKYYWKQILSGMFITITMTGLDQDMMQKNLTCKSLRAAQKNVLSSSLMYVVVNILFLCLGAALIAYAQSTGFELPTNADGVVMGDKIFPSVAFHLSTFTAVVFILGMVAAGYSSADGTLTALTTTFCFDFLGFDKSSRSERQLLRIRRLVHVGFALLYLLVIIAFRPFHNQSLIDTLFDIAGFTYGPLLGFYTFGLFTKRKVRDRLVPIVALLSPVICYILKLKMPDWTGYHFGFEILLLNGLLTFLGMLALSRKDNAEASRIGNNN